MAGRPRMRMSVEQRAKQFMPFAALRGLPEALALKEKVAVPKIELSEERAEELDRKMHMLQKGQIATAIYFAGGEYLKKTGMIAGIDENARVLRIVNDKIAFDDILDIEPDI